MSNLFTVQDISFVSPKTQAGNLREAQVQSVTQVNDIPQEPVETNIPQAVTLESAINYFEDNAVGEFENLYKFTAKSLIGLRQLRNPVVASANAESDLDV